MSPPLFCPFQNLPIQASEHGLLQSLWTLDLGQICCAHPASALWISTISSPASAIFNVSSNEGINAFSRETWSGFLVCRRRDDLLHSWGKKWRWCHKEGEEQTQPSFPSLSCVTSWDTWCEKWASDLASALQFTCVFWSVESIMYFSCRPKGWVCLSVPK